MVEKNPFKSFEDIGSQQLLVDHLLSSLVVTEVCTCLESLLPMALSELKIGHPAPKLSRRVVVLW